MAIYKETATQELHTEPSRSSEWRMKLEEDARVATLTKNALWSFHRTLQKVLGVELPSIECFSVTVEGLHFIYTHDLEVHLVVKCWKCPKGQEVEIELEDKINKWADLVTAYNKRHTLCQSCEMKEAGKKVATLQQVVQFDRENTAGQANG